MKFFFVDNNQQRANFSSQLMKTTTIAICIFFVSQKFGAILDGKSMPKILANYRNDTPLFMGPTSHIIVKKHYTLYIKYKYCNLHIFSAQLADGFQ